MCCGSGGQLRVLPAKTSNELPLEALPWAPASPAPCNEAAALDPVELLILLLQSDAAAVTGLVLAATGIAATSFLLPAALLPQHPVPALPEAL